MSEPAAMVTDLPWWMHVLGAAAGVFDRFKELLLTIAEPTVSLGVVLVVALYYQVKLLGAASRDPARKLDLTTVIMTDGHVDPAKVMGIAILEICLWAFALITIKGQMTMVWFNTTFLIAVAALLGKEWLDLKRAALAIATGTTFVPDAPPPAVPPAPGTVKVETTVTPQGPSQ